MEAFLKELLSYIPHHPLKERVEAYSGSNMVVFKPRIIFPGPVFSHNYQFVIPFCEVPNLVVEKRTFKAERNKIFPINPEQAHGTESNKEKEVGGYYSLVIKKDFLRETARSVFGKADIIFHNVPVVPDSDFWRLIHSFVEEAAGRQQGFEFIQEAVSLQIAVSFLRHLKNNMPVSSTPCNYSEKENINRAIEFIRELFNKNYSLEELARVANLSPYHFIRVFKAQTGKTPYQYLLDVKIEKAREMLRLKRHTITEVCFACGFNNLSHFTAVFKRKVGVSPSSYREET